MTDRAEQSARGPARGTLVASISICTLAVFSFLGVLTVEHATSNSILLAILLFCPILCVLFLLLFLEIRRRPYSLNLMHLIALLLFVGLAPMFQVALGRYPLEIRSQVVIGNVIWANVACLLWVLSYSASYRLTELRAARRKAGVSSLLTAPISTIGAALMFALALVALIWLWRIGLGGAATREVAQAALGRIGGPLQLVSGTFVRGFPYVALLAAIAVFRHQRNLLLVPPILVLALAAAYLDNPMAAPRYWTVAILLGILAPILLDRRRTGSALLILAIAGMVVMPALDLGRRLESVEEVLFEFRFIELPSPASYLAENGDLASYGILTLGFDWVDRYGHTWGRQLLGGVVLFWVPRSLWPDKPISTGAQIVGDLGFDFTVLSAPIMADAYLDFGLIGILGFAALVGAALARLDCAYAQKSDYPRVIDSFYPFLLGMMLFVTRGSLMSAFPYTVSFVGCAAPLALVAIFRSRLKGRTAVLDGPSQ